MSGPPEPRNAPPPTGTRVRIGELLVQAGVLTRERLDEALAMQQAEGGKRRLGRLLVDQGFVDETLFTQVLGRQLSVPWVSLYHVDFSRQLLNLVPREVAEGYGLVPVYVRHVRGQGDTLYVATDDPTNEEGLRRAAAYAGLPVRPMIASASDIRAAIRVYYGGGAAKPPIPVKVETVETTAPPPTVVARPQKKPESDEPTRAAEPAALPPAPPAKPDLKVTAPTGMPSPVATRPEPAAEKPMVPAPARPSPSKPRLAALVDGMAETRGSAPADDDGPEIEARPIEPRRKRKAIALTFLDGTTINLPAPRPRVARGAHEMDESEDAPASGDDGLTARDLIAALRAVSGGAEAKEILGENPRWEAMFAALLSVLLKKHLIADWEFVEEYRKL